MNLQHAGFTLIELMIVVAIIGILASVAIPSYQQYTSRAQVIEAVTLSTGLKLPLYEWLNDKGALPGSVTSLTDSTTGKYVDTIALGGTAIAPTITATMKPSGLSNEIQSKTFVLSSSDGGNNWECNTGTIPSKYLPSSCQ